MSQPHSLCKTLLAKACSYRLNFAAPLFFPAGADLATLQNRRQDKEFGTKGMK